MASAILCVSSFFFIAPPRRFDASSSSAASFSRIVFSPARGGVLDDPADRERRPAVGPHFDGHLVGRAADAARLDLERRLDVLDRLLEGLHRIVLRLLGNLVQGAVQDPFGDGLLALDHHGVDELRDELGVVERIRQDFALRQRLCVSAWS